MEGTGLQVYSRGMKQCSGFIMYSQSFSLAFVSPFLTLFSHLKHVASQSNYPLCQVLPGKISSQMQASSFENEMDCSCRWIFMLHGEV